jgi:putative redox protein
VPIIQVDSLPPAYRGIVRNSSHELTSDAPIAKGGGGMGFGAHDLLEASLAACLNMAVRMHADVRGIPGTCFNEGYAKLARRTDSEV